MMITHTIMLPNILLDQKYYTSLNLPTQNNQICGLTQLSQAYGVGHKPKSSQNKYFEIIQQSQQYALLQMVLKSQSGFLNVCCGGWLLLLTSAVTVLGVAQFSQISHTQS